MGPTLQSLVVQREPVSDLVFNALRDAIVNRNLLPGASVSEASLARELKVSKTPVREALLRLRELHLVELDSNRRLRVLALSLAAITAAYEARAVLEGGVSALAAIRATSDQRAELRHAAERTVQAATEHDAQQFSEWDTKFHTGIADAADSAHLTKLTKNNFLLTAALRARDVPITGDSLVCASEHVAIVDAICDRDEDAATSLAMTHVRHVAANVLEAFKVSSQTNTTELSAL